MVLTKVRNELKQPTRTCSKNRQDCEHPKNGQFDTYTITSNFLKA